VSTVLSPDERAFRAHLETARFLSGADAGQWRILSIDWPIVFVALSAAPRINSPSEYVLRVDACGYPTTSATACVWDLSTNAALLAEERPAGHIADQVFRTDWSNGEALYAPWDRMALPGHEAWATSHPELLWTPDRDFTFYLENVWEVLNADDYTGKRSA